MEFIPADEAKLFHSPRRTRSSRSDIKEKSSPNVQRLMGVSASFKNWTNYEYSLFYNNMKLNLTLLEFTQPVSRYVFVSEG